MQKLIAGALAAASVVGAVAVVAAPTEAAAQPYYGYRHHGYYGRPHFRPYYRHYGYGYRHRFYGRPYYRHHYRY